MIKVSEISSELTRQWDALEGTNKTRASLFNLIVISPKNKREEYVRTITHKVLERFPSRVIFITIDSELQDDTLQASVSLVQGARGEYDVMCDFIGIEASPKSQQKIPFILLPHLLPDLPIYLLWEEDPVLGNALCKQLEKMMTRIIFDSEVTDNLSDFARSLLQHHQGSEIADLNWARTENWRELISSTFYSPARLESLQNAKKIRIAYNSYETQFFCHTKIQALYIQSWLSTQLGWKLTSAKPGLFQYGPLAIELVPESDQNLAPGTIISIDITISNQDHFSFCRDKKTPNHVRAIICDTEKCDIPSTYIFTKTHSGLSLVNEITKSGTSAHFLSVITFLSTVDPQCLS